MADSRHLIDFRAAAASFDEPLELWQACHERVQRMLALLQRLLEHLQGHGADEAARITAASIRRYFDEAAPRHHEDEEIDLFPRLAAKRRLADAARIAQAIAALRADHADLSALWQALRPALLAVEQGELPAIDSAAVALFVDRYRAHIALEERELAPALARALGKRDRMQIGRAMALRRGVAWDRVRR